MEVQNWQNKQISKIQEQQKKQTIEMQKHRTHNFLFFFKVLHEKNLK